MTDKNINQQTGGGPEAIEAMAFFKLSGRQESYKAGTCIFPEVRRLRHVAPTDARIYLLVSGAVTLTRYGKPISLVMPGEIFGAMSVILPSSHFTTAKALKDCTVIGLEPKQFLRDLQNNPAFILTLLNDLARRLQSVMARVVKLGRHSAQPPVSIGLNADQIGLLAAQLGDPMPAHNEAGLSTLPRQIPVATPVNVAKFVISSFGNLMAKTGINCYALGENTCHWPVQMRIIFLKEGAYAESRRGELFLAAPSPRQPSWHLSYAPNRDGIDGASGGTRENKNQARDSVSAHARLDSVGPNGWHSGWTGNAVFQQYVVRSAVVAEQE